MNIHNDINFLKSNTQNYFKDVSVAKAYELSKNKYIYKDCYKNKDGDEVYKQYKKLVTALREEKLPFRIIDLLKKKKINVEQLTYNSFKNELFTSSAVLDKLIDISNLPKKEQKKLFHEYEFELVSNCSLEAFELASKINWIHGTNSSILPFWPYTEYSLIPTGNLLDRKQIAPMSGEIREGMGVESVNQQFISVETIKGLSRCWDYAKKISHSFDFRKYDDANVFFETILKKLATLTPSDDQWDVTLISLYRLKQWNPYDFQALCKKHSKAITELKEKLITQHSSKEMMLLKALDYDSEKLKRALTDENVLQEVKDDFPYVRDSFRWDQMLVTGKNGGSLESVFFEEKLFLTSLFNSMNATTLLHVLMLKIFSEESLIRFTKKSPFAPVDLDPRDYPEYKEVQKYDLESETLNLERAMKNKLRPIMEARIQKNSLPYAKRLKRFERLFEDKPFVILNEIDKTHLINPIPILLASTKSKSMGSGNQNIEANIKEAFLGKDIDLIFVNDNDVSTLKSWLTEHQFTNKVHVYSISFFNDLKNIPLYHSPQQILFSKPCISERGLKYINQMVLDHVIPLYQKPYPDQTARKWHGVTHAVRVILFSHVIASLYNLTKLKNLLIAAGLHDVARQNDGVDLWDFESGEMCKDILIENDVPVEEADLLAYAIAEKDYKSPIHIEQKVIHDADCIEILRCLKRVEDFRPEELWIMQELDKDTGYQFIEEAKILIKLTEMDKVKQFLESSKDPLKCLYQILFHINCNYGKCELLTQHLYHCKNTFDSTGDYLLNNELEKFIYTWLSSEI